MYTVHEYCQWHPTEICSFNYFVIIIICTHVRRRVKFLNVPRGIVPRGEMGVTSMLCIHVNHTRVGARVDLVLNEKLS